MKKKIIIIILIVLLFVIITMMFGCKKKASLPAFSYTFTEKINTLTESEYDWNILFRVESPELDSGYFALPYYSSTVEYICTDQQNSLKLSEIKTSQKAGTDECEEAYDILWKSGFESEYLEKNNDFRTEDIIVRDKAEYRLAFVFDGSTDSERKRSEKGHTGIFFIYKTDNKKIVYLSEIVLNDNYCFAHANGYFSVEKFSIFE